MRGGKQPCFALAAAVLLAGCSSSQFRRIDANREVYESWPIEMRQAVLDGKVQVGMTPDMVKMALGKPTEVVSRSTVPGEDEIWVYRTGGDPDMSPMMSSPMIGMGGGGLGGVGITTGRGGTSLGTNIGTGIGITPGIGINPGIGMTPGVAMPMQLPPTPVEEREVVFRNGVVYRADTP